MKGKKAYEKPRAYVERFELSQHIAACAWDMPKPTPGEEGCIATSDTEWGLPAGLTMFTDISKCAFTPSAFESFCYTTGAEGNNLFNS